VFCLPISNLLAEDTNTPITTTTVQAVAVTPATSSSTVASAKLPYGVEDVLKLSQANINENIIVNYVQNSGTIYNLSPQDIVTLKNQGVSDHVLSAMLNQRKQVESAAQLTTQVAPAVPNAPAVPDANVAPAAPDYYDQGAVYEQPQPAPAASSSVYVIPYPQATAAYYGYYSYPYGYYRPYYYGGYYGPSISLGFRFGGHGYYGRGFYGHGSHHGYGHGWHR
jgi:hypothetical protein